MINNKVEKLLAGETIISKEPGNSMLPIIKSKQPLILEPATLESVEVGYIIYAKYHGKLYTHIVKSKNVGQGVLIGNNKGHINGLSKQVFGKVISIL